MLRPHLQPSGFKPHMLPNDSRCRLDAFESILIFIGVKYFLGIIREALWEAILYKLKQVVSSFGKHCNQPSWITPTDSDLFGWNNDEVKQGFLCIRYFQYVWFFLKSLTPWLSISWNSPKFSHIWSHFRFCSWRNWYQDGFLKQTFPPPKKKCHECQDSCKSEVFLWCSAIRESPLFTQRGDQQRGTCQLQLCSRCTCLYYL